LNLALALFCRVLLPDHFLFYALLPLAFHFPQVDLALPLFLCTPLLLCRNESLQS